MVRSSKFCFDDGREPDREGEREHFTEEDDRLLEEFVPQKPAVSRRLERKRRPRVPTQNERRHLAGADERNPGTRSTTRRAPRNE